MHVRRRRHYGFTSFSYIALTALLALGAVNSQNNLLFIAFGLALAALLVSGFVSGTTIVRIRVTREPIGAGQVGEPLAIRYEIRNTSRALPAFALTVRERAIPRAKKPLTGLGTRAKGAPSWPSLMPEPRAFAAHIAPKGVAHAEAVVRPTRRGVATFHAIRVESSFPFGILRKSATFVPGEAEAPTVALIRPRAIAPPTGLLREATRDPADGDATSRAIGRADEFFGLRDYAPGDTMRQIAWRASARSGELVVRENVSHAPTRLWVGLAPLRPGEVADAALADALTEGAISLAAGLLEEAGRMGIDVGLFAPGLLSHAPAPEREGEGLLIAPRAGPAHVGRLLDALATLDLTPRDVRGTERQIPPQAERATWIVVHAGEPDARVGPPGATRLSATRLVGTSDAPKNAPKRRARKAPIAERAA